jgi:hypothetical protein
MQTLCRYLGLGLAWLSLGSPGRADFLFQFTDDFGTPTASFTTSVSGTVDVRVYLVEFGSPGDVLAMEGLFSTGVRITSDVGGIAQVLTAGDISPNPAFVNLDPPPTAGPTEASFDGDVGFNDFLLPDGANRIYLGTFSFAGSSIGMITITAGDRNTPAYDDTVTGFGTVLDSDIAEAVGTITVTGTAAVPEPAGVLLLGLGAATLLGFCQRRRRSDT